MCGTEGGLQERERLKSWQVLLLGWPSTQKQCWTRNGKNKNPNLLSLKKNRVREIQRLTFNSLGLKCTKGLDLCVVPGDRSRANWCRWREEDLKPKWRTFRYQLQGQYSSNSNRKNLVYNHVALGHYRKIRKQRLNYGNVVKGSRANCRPINIVLCFQVLKIMHVSYVYKIHQTDKCLPCIIIFFHFFNEHI